MIEIKCTERQKKAICVALEVSGECYLDKAEHCHNDCGICVEENIKWDIQPEPLKPCPCCGGEARHFEKIGGMYVKCTTCGLQTDFCETKSEAEKKWNRRVNND